ncbi:MAG: hypothetical protein ACPG8W_17975 [Candidatus Promineifilaceae bacterium]
MKNASKHAFDHTYQAELVQQQAAYEAAVSAEFAKLEADPICKRSLEKRKRTIQAVADADADPTRTRKSAFEEPGVIGRATFYNRKSTWFNHPPFRAVLDAVVGLTLDYERKKEGRRREARRSAHKERMLSVTERVLAKIDLMLDMPLTEQKIDSNGVITIKPVNWNLRDVASLVNAADKAARLALDMDTAKEKHDVTSKGEQVGRPVSTEDVKQWTRTALEELNAWESDDNGNEWDPNEQP